MSDPGYNEAASLLCSCFIATTDFESLRASDTDCFLIGCRVYQPEAIVASGMGDELNRLARTPIDHEHEQEEEQE